MICEILPTCGPKKCGLVRMVAAALLFGILGRIVENERKIRIRAKEAEAGGGVAYVSSDALPPVSLVRCFFPGYLASVEKVGRRGGHPFFLLVPR